MALPLRYPLRSLAHRRLRTGLTVAVVALVVIATTLFLALVSSLRRTLVSTGSPQNLIVLRKGSDNDGSSQLPLDAYQAVRFFEGIALSLTIGVLAGLVPAWSAARKPVVEALREVF